MRLPGMDDRSRAKLRSRRLRPPGKSLTRRLGELSSAEWPFARLSPG